MGLHTLMSNTETTSADKGPLSIVHLSVSIFESVCESVKWGEVCKCDLTLSQNNPCQIHSPFPSSTLYMVLLDVKETHLQHILLQFDVFVNGTKYSVRKNVLIRLIRSWKIQELSDARTRYYILMVTIVNCWNCTNPQVIQDVEYFISLSEQILRNLA